MGKTLHNLQVGQLNRVGHEEYESKEEQKRVFNSYYSNQIKDDSQMIVLGFKML